MLDAGKVFPLNPIVWSGGPNIRPGLEPLYVALGEFYAVTIRYEIHLSSPIASRGVRRDRNRAPSRLWMPRNPAQNPVGRW